MEDIWERSLKELLGSMQQPQPISRPGRRDGHAACPFRTYAQQHPVKHRQPCGYSSPLLQFGRWKLEQRLFRGRILWDGRRRRQGRRLVARSPPANLLKGTPFTILLVLRLGKRDILIENFQQNSIHFFSKSGEMNRSIGDRLPLEGDGRVVFPENVPQVVDGGGNWEGAVVEKCIEENLEQLIGAVCPAAVEKLVDILELELTFSRFVVDDANMPGYLVYPVDTPFHVYRQLIANLVDRAKPVLGIDIFKRCEGGVESEGLFNIIPQNLPDQVVVSSELTRFFCRNSVRQKLVRSARSDIRHSGRWFQCVWHYRFVPVPVVYLLHDGVIHGSKHVRLTDSCTSFSSDKPSTAEK